MTFLPGRPPDPAIPSPPKPKALILRLTLGWALDLAMLAGLVLVAAGAFTVSITAGLLVSGAEVMLSSIAVSVLMAQDVGAENDNGNE